MKTIMRRALSISTCLVILVALCYTEEDLRGWRAWENCKHELEAKGAALDWSACIPPPVPDGQNFFEAPKMQEWFVRNGLANTNELYGLVTNADKVAVITNILAAADFLAWSGQFQSDFDLMRQALKRPCARMDGDYSRPSEIPVPNFVNVRAVAQTLAQRAKCYLLLGRPEEALREVTLLNDSRHFLEGAPTGKPMTLATAMLYVAVAGLYVDTVADGMRSHSWQEPQLVALQKQLKTINLTPLVVGALNEEPAAMRRTIETTKANDFEKEFVIVPRTNLWQKLDSPLFVLFTFAPRGWVYQNMVWVATLEQKPAELIDCTNQIISSRGLDDATRELFELSRHPRIYTFLASLWVPDFSRAAQTLAHNQTLANEAQIVCALERYHLARGEYPEALEVLTPQFIEKMPHDIIGGQPFIYRATADGKFLLYSVGWNAKDDGGRASSPNQYGWIDYTEGDWVWKN